MNNDNNDIKEKLGEPQWYDEYGVPGCCEFHPYRCGVCIEASLEPR